MEEKEKTLLQLILRALDVLVKRQERMFPGRLPRNIAVIDPELEYARSCLDEAQEIEKEIWGD